jgi:hypothetical protein
MYNLYSGAVSALGLVVLAACGAGTSAPNEPQGVQSSSQGVLCSATQGALVGPPGTLVDAGDVQQCGLGGQCVNTALAPGGNGGWGCVYESGYSGVDGGDGG